MTYLLFLTIFFTAYFAGIAHGRFIERLRQNRGRVAVLRIAQKYQQARAGMGNN